MLKDEDAHIKFALLTGVSKFSTVSLFSGLNNLKDITVDARYSAICGYTDDDVNQVFAPELGQWVTMDSLLSTFDVDEISSEALLFQSGYLTIDSQFKMGARTEYTLKYPNQEVESSLNGVLLQALTARSTETARQSGRLYRLLQANDFAGLQALFTAFFASIPNDWYRSNKIASYEGATRVITPASSTATSPRWGWTSGWRM